MSAESAMIKYADKITTEGNNPPQIALKSVHRAQPGEVPKERENIAKEPYDDKVKRQCVTATNQLSARGNGTDELVR